MTYCNGIGIKNITSSKVYLNGTITGIDSSKQYCLHYYSWDWKNVPNGSVQYTYISGRTSYNLETYGCYIPTTDLVEGSQFEVRLHEIEGQCENIISAACTKILLYEVIEQKYVHFYVRDDKGNPIGNTKIEIAGQSFYTGSDGKAYRILDTGITYYSRGYAPSGYTCTDCYEQFYHDSDRVVNFYVKKTVTYCDIDFYVCDQEAYPVNGATCSAGGKTSTTNTSGMCSITLVCGNSYTATCNAPSGYTCDCGGCECSHGPFTPTTDGFITFSLDKVVAPIEYCQQNFKVLDQNGEPVEYVIVGCEDLIDYTNFNVLGHSGTGTSADGTVSTLKTIKSRAYNFYISQLPAGYDFDIDGVSSINNVVACTSEALFRIKDLSIIPDPCSVNVCVQDQDGNNIAGVAIYIKNIGTVYTKDDISMFGCTGKVGITCGNSTTVTATVPSGYEGVKTTETFTASGDKSVILTIMESANGVVCTGKTKAECDAEPNCYWWNSDNACHDTPAQAMCPTLNITSDMDALSGISAYVDGTLRGVTPVTISFTEDDIGRTVSLSGMFAGIMKTRPKDVILKQGINEVMLDLLMDNKEILAGGSIASILLMIYA